MDLNSILARIIQLEDPMKWLPIGALVIAMFHAVYLLFLTKQELEYQFPRQQLQERYYAMRLREILLWILQMTLAWTLLIYVFRS